MNRTMRMTIVQWLVGELVLSATLTGVATAEPTLADIREIKPPQWSDVLQGWDINNYGAVVGFLNEGALANALQQRGFVSIQLALIPINRPHGPVTCPNCQHTVTTGINDKGQIVGVSVDAGRVSGFLFSNGRFQTIQGPGNQPTAPYAINNRGDIVGSFGDDQSFMLSGDTFRTIDPPGSSSSRVYDINDRQQIVGEFMIGVPEIRHGYLLTEGKYTQIDVPGSRSTVAYGINNRGHIAGVYTDAAGERGFVLSNGVLTSIDVPGSVHTQVVGINDYGEIVGNYTEPSGKSHTFKADVRSFQ
jgi:probable HAF family extracellular repeat protein